MLQENALQSAGAGSHDVVAAWIVITLILAGIGAFSMVRALSGYGDFAGAEQIPAQTHGEFRVSQND
jgi:hypothetical protein